MADFHDERTSGPDDETGSQPAPGSGPPLEAAHLVEFDTRLIACLLGTGQRNGPRVLFGKRADGALYHISLVDDAILAEGLSCPDCGHALVAVRGPKVSHHFRHRSTMECRTAGETALHVMGKQIIQERGWVHVPATEAVGRTLREQVGKAGSIVFDEVWLEQPMEGMRPDIRARKGDRDLLIEIKVTHAVDEVKLARVEAQGISMLEIDLGKVKRDLNVEGLAELILSDAPRQWLFNTAQRNAQEKIEKREAEKAARKKVQEDAQIEQAIRLWQHEQDLSEDHTLLREVDRKLADLGVTYVFDTEQRPAPGFASGPCTWQARIFRHILIPAMVKSLKATGYHDRVPTFTLSGLSKLLSKWGDTRFIRLERHLIPHARKRVPGLLDTGGVVSAFITGLVEKEILEEKTAQSAFAVEPLSRHWAIHPALITALRSWAEADRALRDLAVAAHEKGMAVSLNGRHVDPVHAGALFLPGEAPADLDRTLRHLARSLADGGTRFGIRDQDIIRSSGLRFHVRRTGGGVSPVDATERAFHRLAELYRGSLYERLLACRRAEANRLVSRMGRMPMTLLPGLELDDFVSDEADFPSPTGALDIARLELELLSDGDTHQHSTDEEGVATGKGIISERGKAIERAIDFWRCCTAELPGEATRFYKQHIRGITDAATFTKAERAVRSRVFEREEDRRAEQARQRAEDEKRARWSRLENLLRGKGKHDDWIGPFRRSRQRAYGNRSVDEICDIKDVFERLFKDIQSRKRL